MELEKTGVMKGKIQNVLVKRKINGKEWKIYRKVGIITGTDKKSLRRGKKIERKQYGALLSVFVSTSA